MEKIVIIPTYNEQENIGPMIRHVMSMGKSYHILVVDDDSPDGTATIVKAMQADYPDALFIEERKGKLGLGTAYIHGFRWAMRAGYQFIFEMDADFSHHPDDLERLCQACREGADMAVGSRYVKGGRVVNWPLDRNLLSKSAALYTQMITWLPANDPTAGFVCYRREVLEAINLDAIRFVGYAFQIEMKFAVWKLGFQIREIPIVFTDRERGVSKMNKGIIKEGIIGVLLIQWQSFFHSYAAKAMPRSGLTT
ncbi:MAG: polyprenol monophosphomannose synthase [Bacteroidetes bacterium]|nr:polyprenol monophosphomannose synthase [Bacteroidota bacterium]